MEPLLAIAGVVFAAVISPGPNNFVVMRNAALHGPGGAVVAIGCVVGGTLMLVLVVASGATLIFDAVPALVSATTLIGSVYLCYLGVKLLFAGSRREHPAHSALETTSPVSVPGLIAFQFLNPKSWVIVMTATSFMAERQDAEAFPAALLAVFFVVPTVCLTAWAAAGFALSELLRQPSFRRRFDSVMGVLLITSGLALLD